MDDEHHQYDWAIVNMCLEREHRIRERLQCIHINESHEEDRRQRIMRQPAAPWDSSTRIESVRRFSKGAATRKHFFNHAGARMSRRTKERTKTESAQWHARLERLRMGKNGGQDLVQRAVADMTLLNRDWGDRSEEGTSPESQAWVESEGRQILRSWRRMQRSMPELTSVPPPTGLSVFFSA